MQLRPGDTQTLYLANKTLTTVNLCLPSWVNIFKDLCLKIHPAILLSLNLKTLFLKGLVCVGVGRGVKGGSLFQE